MLPEKLFNTGEIVLNYIEGPKSGPPVVMLHGLTGRYQTWGPFTQRLMVQWHVFACDLRGHGKSGRAPGQYQLVDFGRDIVVFLRGCFTEPAVLVGVSLGAMTALEVACRAPKLVRALVLLDPPLYMRNQPLAANTWVQHIIQFVYEALKPPQSYETILARCRAESPTLDDAFIQDQADQFNHVDVGTVTACLQAPVGLDGDLEGVLQSITAPTLLIHGDWDHNAAVRDEDATYFKALIPQATIIKIPNGSHNFLFEQTDLTLEHMQNFLKSI